MMRSVCISRGVARDPPMAYTIPGPLKARTGVGTGRIRRGVVTGGGSWGDPRMSRRPGPVG